MLLAIPLAFLLASPQAAPAPQKAASSSCAEDQRWGDVGHALFDDVKGLASKDFLLTFGVGLGAAGAVHPLDDNADRWADGMGPSEVTQFGEYVGKWGAQVPLIGGALLAGAAMKPPCFPAFGSDLTRALALTAGLTIGIKYAVQRERPNQENNLSFLSGHSSSTFALSTVALHYFGWKAGAPAYALSIYTAWSRVRDNKHWLSDTVAGAALGLAVGRVIVRPRKASTSTSGTWTVVPVTRGRGAGVYVIRQ